MIITIDGPTASGKSTVAQLLAEQLCALYINSGLLFRAVAYVACIENGSLENVLSSTLDYLKSLFASKILIYSYQQIGGAQVLYNGSLITKLLKTAEIDQAASEIALQQDIRQAILDYERELANNCDVIADGRDCGTIVFPHASYKFFLTASLEVRAHRWQKLARSNGDSLIAIEECKKIVASRDIRDSTRDNAPLKPAADAFIIDTSHMTIQEVLAVITEKL